MKIMPQYASLSALGLILVTMCFATAIPADESKSVDKLSLPWGRNVVSGGYIFRGLTDIVHPGKDSENAERSWALLLSEPPLEPLFGTQDRYDEKSGCFYTIPKGHVPGRDPVELLPKKFFMEIDGKLRPFHALPLSSLDIRGYRPHVSISSKKANSPTLRR